MVDQGGMKLTFIGVGSAFTRKNYNSGVVLEYAKTRWEVGGHNDGDPVEVSEAARLMIDCGRTAPEALAAAGLRWHDINALYVTHAHSDHVGGMEEFAFARMFIPPKSKPTLYAERGLMEDLWAYTLKGGLGPGQNGKRFHLEDYFDLKPVVDNFRYENTIFEPVRLPHIMDSYGLKITTPPAHNKPCTKIFYSSDSIWTPLLLDHWLWADIIFQDCEIAAFKSGVHAHYMELVEMPAEFKKKMWLYHYQDIALPDAKADGFAGFVAKGQSFEF